MMMSRPRKKCRVENLSLSRTYGSPFGIPDLGRHIFSFLSLKDLANVISRTTHFFRSQVLAINLVRDPRFYPYAPTHSSTWVERRIRSELGIDCIYSIVLFYLHITDDPDLHFRVRQLSWTDPLDQHLWWDCLSHLLKLLDMPTIDDPWNTCFLHYAVMAWAHGLGDTIPFIFLDKMCAQAGYDRHEMSWMERNDFRLGLYETYSEELRVSIRVGHPAWLKPNRRDWNAWNEANGTQVVEPWRSKQKYPIVFVSAYMHYETALMVADPCTLAFYSTRKPEMTLALFNMLLQPCDYDVIFGSDNAELVESYRQMCYSAMVFSLNQVIDGSRFLFEMWKTAYWFWDEQSVCGWLNSIFCPTYTRQGSMYIEIRKLSSYAELGYVSDFTDSKAPKIVDAYITGVKKGVGWLIEMNDVGHLDALIESVPDMIRRLKDGSALGVEYTGELLEKALEILKEGKAKLKLRLEDDLYVQMEDA